MRCSRRARVDAESGALSHQKKYMSPRESILVFGASGRTGLFVLRYLCTAAVPVIACVRRTDRLPAEPRLAAAEVAIADLEQPSSAFRLIDRAAHIVWLAGTQRKSLSPGAWQLEVDALSTCLDYAVATGFTGRWLQVGHTPTANHAATWAETRWRELKAEAEQTLEASGVNYFVVRTGQVTGMVTEEPRVSVSQRPGDDGELPCNALAFLLTGAALAGAPARTKATVRVDRSGVRLQEAVQSFGRLRPDVSVAILR